MKKAFTLVELISVIIIIGVVALISTPIVTNIIDNSKEKTYEETIANIENAAYYYSVSNELGYKQSYESIELETLQTKGYMEYKEIIDPRNNTQMEGCVFYRWLLDEKEYEFIYDDDCVVDDIYPEIKINILNENKLWLQEKLKFEIDSKYDSYKYCVGNNDCDIDKNYTGTTTVEKDGKNMYICAVGYFGDVPGKSTCVGPYNVDTVSPEITSNKVVGTSSKIVVNATCSDDTSLVKEIKYSINGGEYQESNLFTNLKTGEYKVKTKCIDNALNESEVEATVELKMSAPTIAQVSQTPSSGTWAQKRVIRITYSGANVESPKYYYSLDNSTWTQVTSTTKDIEFTSNGYLYAKTVDNAGNIASAAAFTVVNVDSTKPSTSIAVSNVKTDRATITATCSDNESKIAKYEFSKDNGATWVSNGTTASYTFTGLTQGTSYTYKVRCTNGSGITNEASSAGSTSNITNPTIAYENTPETAVNGYLKKQILKVTYNNTNIQSPTYYVKTTRAGVSSLAVTQSCGTDTNPSNCSTITSTTSLAANTWYKVSGNVNITYDTYAISEGTLYAVTYDGINFSGAATKTISKITKDVTYIVKHYQMNTDMTNYTLYETETLTATANYTATPGVKTYTGFNSPSTQTVTVKADGSTVVEYKYARKQIVVTFYRNTSSSDTTTATQTFTYGVTGQAFTNKGWSKTGSTQIGWTTTASGAYYLSITCGVEDYWISNNSPSIKLYAVWVENPTITLTNTPTTAVNGYLTKQVATVKYPTTNLTTPVYYIKTTRSGVSNIAVTSSCGTGTNPGTCSTITSTTSLAANTWYKVSGNLTVAYTAASTSEGTIYAYAYDGTSKRTSKTATISKIDTTGPNASIATSVKTDRATVTATCSDAEANTITKYEFSKDNGTTWVANGTTSSYTFTGLTQGTSYTFAIRCTNGLGLTKTASGAKTISNITNPTIALVSTPTISKNGYLTSQVAKITYNKTNISNPTYYVKTTRAGVSNVAVTSSCGTGTTPAACSTITSTTSLAANTWYKVSGNVNVTYNIAASSNATIYALTSDGTNFSGAATKTISKIDTSKPSLASIDSTTATSNGINVTATCTDNESGIKKIEISKDGGNTYSLYKMVNSVWQMETHVSLNNTSAVSNVYENGTLIKKYDIASVKDTTQNGIYYASQVLTSGEKYRWTVTMKSNRTNTIGALGQEQGGVIRGQTIGTEFKEYENVFTANENTYKAFVIYGTFNDGDSLYVHSLALVKDSLFSTTASHSDTFTNLSKGSYNIKVRCTNNLGQTTESAVKTVTTANITNPTIAQASQSPSSGTYAQSRVIKITYTGTNVTSPGYYFKSTVAGTVASGVVTHACGTGTNPGTCTASTVTTLAANTWYKTSSTTPSITYKANGTLYALTGDGTNVSGTASYSIANIDTTVPSASIATSVKTDRATVTATCADSESKIAKYEYSKDNGATWVANGTTASYTFTGLKQGTSYTFAVRCTNGSGLTKTASGAKATASITKPTIAQASQSPSSGTYAQSRVIKITYTATNIQTPEYYFKSSVAATVASGVVTHACGTSTNPGTCSASSVTTLAANTWYKTSSTTPSITYKANGTLYAQTWDPADNSAAASTFTIANIDTTVPTVNVEVSTKFATLTLGDNIGLSGYTVTTSTTTPTTWTSVTGTSATKTWTASAVGTYYAWVKDVAGRTTYKKFAIENIQYVDSVLNGADPVIKENLIPVVISNDGTVKKANIYSEWYNYTNKNWANAVILKNKNIIYQNDEVIPSSNIDSYFVWVPRYKYEIFNEGNYTSATTVDSAPTESAAQEINIVFETKDVTPSTGTKVGEYLTHPAFTTLDVNGIWVAKFETSGTTSDINVLPNAISLRSLNVKTMFETAYNYDRSLDSHMMKNTEWGAVAYLSHSKYGITQEIRMNNATTFTTGCAATTPPGTSSACQNAYNTSTGYLASTTGNISGIYDMSGGAWEYMAAYMDGVYGSSGLNASIISSYDSKYFDKYQKVSGTSIYSNRILGDATGEMGPFYYYKDSDGASREHSTWYADYAIPIDINYPSITRGGDYSKGNLIGLFYFIPQNGTGYWNGSFRLVLS